MRGIFVGTVEISWHCLRTLLEMGEEIQAIFTQPDERAPQISAHKGFDDLARQFGVPIFKTKTINSPENVARMRALEPEIIYVIGWPRLIKRPLLDMPPKGCIGIHSSLLPKYRGGAPVNWGLIHGETEWGISLMYLEDGPDIGDIIAQESFDIAQEDTCKTVYDKATEASVRTLRKYVPLLAKGAAPRLPQDDNLATLFQQRQPEQGLIDWHKGAWEIYNWIRALTHPYPGAFTFLPDGRKLFIWQADPPGRHCLPPGLSLPACGRVAAVLPYVGAVVQTGDSPLVVTRLQTEGDLEMSATIWMLRQGIEKVHFINRDQNA